MKLTLSKPVRHRGKVYRDLILTEPNGRQMEAAERDLGVPPITAHALRRYQITLIAKVAKVPRDMVLAMKVRDITRAFDFLTPLMSPPEPEPKSPNEATPIRRKPARLRLVA